MQFPELNIVLACVPLADSLLTFAFKGTGAF